jgi:ParB-like chromosome segregation protein Spo0J
MTDYSRPFPPITVTTDGEGGFAILDGNHRVRSWRDEGFTHAPAWIFDDRDEKRVE